MLHHDKVGTVLGPNVVNRDDVWVIQGACSSRFLHETLLLSLVEKLVVRQNLDCDCAMQTGVTSAIDNTHPAFTEFRFDPVMVERLADHEPYTWHSILCLHRCSIVARASP